MVDDRDLAVVGVLEPGFSTFTKSYLVPRSVRARELFPARGPAASVHHAVLVEMKPEDLRNRKTLEGIESAFPSAKYVYVTPPQRLDRPAFYLYLAGQTLLLIGGSAALIGLYRWLAGRVRPAWLAAPLQEMERTAPTGLGRPSDLFRARDPRMPSDL